MVVATVRVVFFGEGSVLATEVEVEFSWVSFGLVGGDIFDLEGAFVAVVVEMDVDNLELEERVVSSVWGCSVLFCGVRVRCLQENV